MSKDKRGNIANWGVDVIAGETWLWIEADPLNTEWVDVVEVYDNDSADYLPPPDEIEPLIDIRQSADRGKNQTCKWNLTGLLGPGDYNLSLRASFVTWDKQDVSVHVNGE